MRCRNCNQEYDHLVKGADRELCARCRGGRVDANEDSSAHAAADSTKDCPACAEPIRARATICRYCGHDVRMPVPPPSERPSRAARGREAHLRPGALPLVKSPALAACLSFLYAGLGQLYCGRIGRGLAIVAGPALFVYLVLVVHLTAGTLVLLWVGLLVFYVWQIFDAHQSAEQANRGLTRAPRARRRSARTRGRKRKKRVTIR